MTNPMNAADRIAVKEVATKFFRWWWNQPGSDTDDGFDEWAKTEGADLLAAINPVPAARTVAWLIERNGAEFTRPHWYTENTTGFHWWTEDAYEAKRFASKAEAEAFPAYQMIASDPDISATEHVFIGSEAPAPAVDGDVVKALQSLRAMQVDDAPYEGDGGEAGEQYEAGQIDGIRFAACRIDAALSNAQATPPVAVAVPDLERPAYCKPHEFLLLASYCGEDTEGCTESRPCTECLAMCNIYGEDGQYLRQLGKPVVPADALVPAPAVGGDLVERLENVIAHRIDLGSTPRAIAEAIATLAGESLPARMGVTLAPAAWIARYADGYANMFLLREEADEAIRDHEAGGIVEPLYAHPLPARMGGPVGTVEAMAGSLGDMAIVKWHGDQPPVGTKLYAHLPKPGNDTGAMDREALLTALVDHNDRLRSAAQIADRRGKETNWQAFAENVGSTLSKHHAITNDARAAISLDRAKP